MHRSDGSGTTFNFVNYLSKVSPEWKSQGRRRHVGAVAGRRRRQGQRRRAAYVKQIKGSIGYVEYAYALKNKHGLASMQNAAGKFVQPSADASPPPRPPPTGPAPRTSTWS